MEILLILALIIAAGSNTPPQKLIHTFSALSSGNAEELWKSDIFKDVRILGMTPAELINAAKELKSLVSVLTVPQDGDARKAAAPFAAQPAQSTQTAPPAAPDESGESAKELQSALSPIRGIADENIEKMLGKYFA